MGAAIRMPLVVLGLSGLVFGTFGSGELEQGRPRAETIEDGKAAAPTADTSFQ